jgi:carotenoid cleavage dioxygenase-like enzyme
MYVLLSTGTANTNIINYNNKIYVNQEASYPFEIKYHNNNTFTSIGYERFGNELDFAVTAHMKVDPEDHNLYFNGYNVVDMDKTRVDMKYGMINKDSLISYVPVQQGF